MNDRDSAKLPRRDFILLPLLSLLTVVLLIGSSELVCRVVWPDYTEDPCALPDGHHKPACSSTLKAMEGPVYQEAYNDCGYRSRASCGPKPPNHIRIALLGSSFTLAFAVPYDEGFPGETEQKLTRACHRPVEIQNLSAVQLQPIQVYSRLDEALALKPDVVVVSINPIDADQDYTDEDMRNRDQPASLLRKSPPPPAFPLRLVKQFQAGLTSILVAQHYRFLDQADYIQHYLQYGDMADFLRQPFSDRWQRRFAQLDVLLGEMADKAHRQGVPIVFISGLSRAQVGLMSETKRPPGVDPFAFDAAFARIAQKHGIIDIDPGPAFSRRPEGTRLFYPVNGHLNAQGNAIYAEVLTQGLLSSGLPVFQSCTRPGVSP